MDTAVGIDGNRKALTASMIDSRDFINARRRAERDVLVPAGPKIAITAGRDFNDPQADLGRPRSRPHEASRHGAAAWRLGHRRRAHRVRLGQSPRKVPQVAFKPDWAKHKKAAPFKRNDAMLAVLPIGVIIFPGTGIQDNLADKARTMGIRPMDFRKKGGG